MSSSAVRTLPPHAARDDVILAGVFFVGGLISAALSSMAEIWGDQQAPLWAAVAYMGLLAATLAVRRRWPAAVAIIACVAYFTATTLRVPEVSAGAVAMFISLYTVGAWMTNRLIAAVVRVSLTVGMFLWLIISIYLTLTDLAEDSGAAPGLFSSLLAFNLLGILLNLLYFGGAYYFGERTWRGATERATLEQRTADLEREREITAAQAIALDRVAIARELHDVVAHHVSVMGVHAGAARTVIGYDDEKAREILAMVEESAREAIRELRTLLQTLRSPGDTVDEPASTHGVEDIPRLIQASNDGGLATVFSVVGEATHLPATVEFALFRVTQESLTNARRHAGSAATVDVRLRYDTHNVELEVVNTGRRVLNPRSGLGTLGMQERVRATGGTLETTPRDQGGFRVRASIPLAPDIKTHDVASGRSLGSRNE